MCRRNASWFLLYNNQQLHASARFPTQMSSSVCNPNTPTPSDPDSIIRIIAEQTRHRHSTATKLANAFLLVNCENEYHPFGWGDLPEDLEACPPTPPQAVQAPSAGEKTRAMAKQLLDDMASKSETKRFHHHVGTGRSAKPLLRKNHGHKLRNGKKIHAQLDELLGMAIKMYDALSELETMKEGMKLQLENIKQSE